MSATNGRKSMRAVCRLIKYSNISHCACVELTLTHTHMKKSNCVISEPAEVLLWLPKDVPGVSLL